MSRARHRWIMLWLLVLGGCGKEPALRRDAGPDQRPPIADLQVPVESGPPSAVDFVVQGCSQRTAGTCGGVVPLVLTFSVVAHNDPLTAKWDLGDGTSPQTGTVVTHSYEKAGTFTVTLSASASGGTISERKVDFVVVELAGPGDACTADGHCSSGKCICHGGCFAPLSSGLCLQSCDKLACSGTAICVDLAGAAASSPAADPWRAHLCLPSCASDADCGRPGFACRVLPGAAGWQRGCWPIAFPRAVGEPCRGADGLPDPGLCLGAVCLDIGASGYCSASCGVSACPDGTRCALFNSGGGSVCLSRCEANGCSDPQLGCEPPGRSGTHGFLILGVPDPAGTAYCAPKHCATDADCGLGGSCDLDQGGFCRSL
jgi:PKD repeat protein